MAEELEAIRDGMWQILDAHKREYEWSGVVVDLLSYLAEQGIMIQTPEGMRLLSDLLEKEVKHGTQGSHEGN